MSWKNPTRKPHIQKEGTARHPVEVGVWPVEYEHRQRLLACRLYEVSKCPDIGVEPSPDVLNIVHQNVDSSELLGGRRLSHSVEGVHWQPGVTVDVVVVALACLPVTSQPVLRGEETDQTEVAWRLRAEKPVCKEHVVKVDCGGVSQEADPFPSQLLEEGGILRLEVTEAGSQT